jgi:hypothetical protein
VNCVASYCPECSHPESAHLTTGGCTYEGKCGCGRAALRREDSADEISTRAPGDRAGVQRALEKLAYWARHWSWADSRRFNQPPGWLTGPVRARLAAIVASDQNKQPSPDRTLCHVAATCLVVGLPCLLVAELTASGWATRLMCRDEVGWEFAIDALGGEVEIADRGKLVIATVNDGPGKRGAAPGPPPERAPVPEHDPVNHPRHYTSHPSGVEAITICEHMTFNLGNATKYIWRAGLKSPSAVEDLKKSVWYIQREIERLSK